MGSGTSTRSHALLEESPLHGIAAECDRCQEVFARDFMPATPKLKLAKRGVVEGIAGEAVRVSDPMNLFEPALRTLALRDGDGAVERHDR